MLKCKVELRTIPNIRLACHQEMFDQPMAEREQVRVSWSAQCIFTKQGNSPCSKKCYAHARSRSCARHYDVIKRTLHNATKMFPFPVLLVAVPISFYFISKRMMLKYGTKVARSHDCNFAEIHVFSINFRSFM